MVSKMAGVKLFATVIHCIYCPRFSIVKWKRSVPSIFWVGSNAEQRACFYGHGTGNAIFIDRERESDKTSGDGTWLRLPAPSLGNFPALLRLWQAWPVHPFYSQ